jgi:hypothetical protein
MGGRIGKKVAGKRGAIGEHIFEEVERLTATGGMNRLAAFKQIADAKGGKPGTVAANYYRIARKRGVALRPRRAPQASQSGRGSGRILATLRLLERQLEQQHEEIQRLRKENASFAKLRRLLA